MKPKFKHDCTNCKYLETVDGLEWYFCEKDKHFMNDIVGRASDEPSDYFSMLTENIWYHHFKNFLHGDYPKHTDAWDTAVEMIKKHSLISDENRKLIERKAKPHVPLCCLGTKLHKLLLRS